MSSILYILMAAVGIGFLIFIHEAGHYICARLAGVRVEIFSLGFGQRLFGFQRGGTDYRVCLVPFGGYVQVAGQDPTRRHNLDDDDLYSKSIGARFLFYSGGVIMNVLFALVAFPIVFLSGIEFNAPQVGSVMAGNPAWEVGFQAGDIVTHVDGKEMYSFHNMAVEVALAGDQDVVFDILRDGEPRQITVRPRYDASSGLYGIGIRPDVDTSQPKILQVDKDSPAARAGLEPGDELLAFGGQPITARTWDEIERQAVVLTPGAEPETVTMTVLGEEGPVDLTYLPAAKDTNAVIGVTPAYRKVAGLRRDVAIVADLGLERGDVILAIDGETYRGGMLDVALQAEAAKPLTVTVSRGEKRVDLTLPSVTPEERDALAHAIAVEAVKGEVRVNPQPDSPAARAGIKVGDRIVSAGDEELGDWNDLRAAVAKASKPGKGVTPIRLMVRPLDAAPDSEPTPITVTPTVSRVADLGFSVEVKNATHRYRVDSVGAAVQAGFVASADFIKQLYVTLKRLVTGEVAAKNLSGIVGISRVSYTFASKGWEKFLHFLAILSINLAFVNVLPIPVLDGGHLLFLLIEKVKGSPVSANAFTYSQVLGLVFVIALMLFVTYNDILRLL